MTGISAMSLVVLYRSMNQSARIWYSSHYQAATGAGEFAHIERRENLVLIAFSSSDGAGESAHMGRLPRASDARIQYADR